MSRVPRRSVTSGAAWAAPVIVVGAAAPMAAASGPVTLGPTATATPGTGNKSVNLSIPGTGFDIGDTYTLTITSITNTVGNNTNWTLPDVTVFTYAGGNVTSVVIKNNDGNPRVTWTATYTVMEGSVLLGSGTFTFVF